MTFVVVIKEKDGRVTVLFDKQARVLFVDRGVPEDQTVDLRERPLELDAEGCYAYIEDFYGCADKNRCETLLCRSDCELPRCPVCEGTVFQALRKQLDVVYVDGTNRCLQTTETSEQCDVNGPYTCLACKNVFHELNELV